jgi:serpin B
MSRFIAVSSVGLVFAVLLAGCSRRSDERVEETSPFQKPRNAEKASGEDRTALARDNTRFALDLHRQLHPDGNLVTSPFAVSTVLAMSLAGAQGKTADEMKQALRFSLDQDRLHPGFAALLWDLNGRGQPRPYSLHLANALWTNRSIELEKEFLDTLEGNYSIGGEHVDFRNPREACRTINDWAHKQTAGRIKEVIQPDEVDENTRLVLASAVSFQGRWQIPFSASRTREGPFHVSSDKTVNVPLMETEANFRYGSFPDGANEKEVSQLIILPFRGATLEFVALLPDKADGLAELEKRLTAEKLGQRIAGARHHTVRLTMPRFEMRSRLALDPTLQALGMLRAFKPGQADFSRLTRTIPIHIDRVVQEAMIVVNEKGAEAAAVVRAMDKDKDKGEVDSDPVEFRADRPFLFLIHHADSGTILFLGRVTNPAAG